MYPWREISLTCRVLWPVHWVKMGSATIFFLTSYQRETCHHQCEQPTLSKGWLAEKHLYLTVGSHRKRFELRLMSFTAFIGNKGKSQFVCRFEFVKKRKNKNAIRNAETEQQSWKRTACYWENPCRPWENIQTLQQKTLKVRGCPPRRPLLTVKSPGS